MGPDSFSNSGLKLYLNLEIAKLSTATRETPHGCNQGKDYSVICLDFVPFPQQCRESVIFLSNSILII